MRPGARAAALWAAVLLGVAAAVFAGASPAPARSAPLDAGPCVPPLCSTTTSSPPATTSPTTSPATTPSTSPTTVAPPPYSVAFVPCGSSGGGPCTKEPSQVQVSYTGTAPQSVQLAWTASGQASGAPAPDASEATMPAADATACGPGLECWPWPARMTDAGFVLNGTYQVAVCASYSGTDCSALFPEGSVGLAAPPGPPTHVEARSSASTVTVSWQPPEQAPPDLVGYSVTRSGRPVYSCSTGGLGPAASVRCPSPLSITDRPGNGSYAYGVTALRLGANSSDQDVVSSPPAAAGGPVTVPGVVTAPGSGPAGGHPGASFTSSPVIGGAARAGGSATPGPSDPAALTGQAGTGASPALGTPGAPQNLQYPSVSPAVGKSAGRLTVREAGAKPDVAPAGLLALGLLILAIAAFVWYLRSEVGAVQARLAAEGHDRP